MHQLWQKEELSHYFWVKFKSNLRCFVKNLHDWQEFYTTAGRSGRAKYQLCVDVDVDHLVGVDENVDGRGDAEEEVAELDHLNIEQLQAE